MKYGVALAGCSAGRDHAENFLKNISAGADQRRKMPIG
jgi:hypothetical protein